MKNIRTLRQKKNMTQETLAKIMRVTVRTVQRWEAGKVRQCYLTDLARVLL